MSKINAMLNEAIINFGTSDMVTILISEKRDMEILEEQRVIYESWKRENMKVSNNRKSEEEVSEIIDIAIEIIDTENIGWLDAIDKAKDVVDSAYVDYCSNQRSIK